MVKGTCDVDLIHTEDVAECKQALANQHSDVLLSQLKMIADEKRFNILQSLLIKKELCVCDLANIIGASMATTSHHLQQLKKIGAVSSRKEGKMLYYQLEKTELIQLIQFGMTLNKEVKRHD